MLSLLLEVVEALLGPLETIQVIHHLLHVVFRVSILDVREPAASHPNDDRDDQHEVLQMVVSVHCERNIGVY